jgi:hypothetical protein
MEAMAMMTIWKIDVDVDIDLPLLPLSYTS